MAKTRPINRGKNTKPPGQGGIGPKYMQSPRGQGGAPSKTEPAVTPTKNASMTKPGSGTRGSGRGAR